MGICGVQTLPGVTLGEGAGRTGQPAARRAAFLTGAVGRPRAGKQQSCRPSLPSMTPDQHSAGGEAAWLGALVLRPLKAEGLAPASQPS